MQSLKFGLRNIPFRPIGNSNKDKETKKANAQISHIRNMLSPLNNLSTDGYLKMVITDNAQLVQPLCKIWPLPHYSIQQNHKGHCQRSACKFFVSAAKKKKKKEQEK